MASSHLAAASRTAAHVHVFRHAGLTKPLGPPPKIEPPLLVESDYAKAIKKTIDLEGALAPILRALPELLDQVERERADGLHYDMRLDASAATRRAQKLFDDARAQIEQSTSQNRLNRIATIAAGDISRAQRNDLKRQAVAAIGVDVVTHDRAVPALVSHFTHQNAVLIKSLGRRGIGDVEKMVAQAFTSGTRHEQLADDIHKRFGVSDRHASLIARDQVGKLRGQISRARNTELGIRKFKWRTMGDPNVRPEHAELDGKTFDYSTGAPGEGMPGEPIACRCTDEPEFDDVIALLNGDEPAPDDEGSDDETQPPSGFDVGADVETDGAKMFDRAPDVFAGVPTYAQAKATPFRSSVFVVRPSDLANEKLLGLDTGGDAPTDSRTASITKAWQHGKEVPPLEIHVSPSGEYFLSDGNHRMWAAAHAGNRPVAVQFRPISRLEAETRHRTGTDTDPVGKDLAKLVKPTSNPSKVPTKTTAAAPRQQNKIAPISPTRKPKGEGAVSNEAAAALVDRFMR